MLIGDVKVVLERLEGIVTVKPYVGNKDVMKERQDLNMAETKQKRKQILVSTPLSPC